MTIFFTPHDAMAHTTAKKNDRIKPGPTSLARFLPFVL